MSPADDSISPSPTHQLLDRQPLRVDPLCLTLSSRGNAQHAVKRGAVVGVGEELVAEVVDDLLGRRRRGYGGGEVERHERVQQQHVEQPRHREQRRQRVREAVWEMKETVTASAPTAAERPACLPAVALQRHAYRVLQNRDQLGTVALEDREDELEQLLHLREVGLHEVAGFIALLAPTADTSALGASPACTSSLCGTGCRRAETPQCRGTPDSSGRWVPRSTRRG